MPLLLDQKFVFVHIPKTGGTSVERVLFDQFPDEFCCFSCYPGFGPMGDYPVKRSEAAARLDQKGASLGVRASLQHWIYPDLSRLIPDVNLWRSCCFVRNPWSRLYSEYCFLFKILFTDRPPDKCFEEWAETALRRAEGDPYSLDNHIRPQHEFIGPGTIIYRYEEFQQGVACLLDDLNVPSGIRLERFFWSGNPPDQYRKVYSPRLVGRVREFYKEDCLQFDYRWKEC